MDPDGRTNQRIMGLDDASIEQSMKEDSVVWGGIKYAFNSTVYEVWNFGTGGFVKRHDARILANESGAITDDQFWRSTVLDGGMSAAGNLAGGGLGNKASALALQRVGGSAAGRVGAQVAGAGTMGGVSNATQQAGEVIDHHLNSNQLGRESISL